MIDPARPPLPGWARLEGDRIAEIGEGAPPGAHYDLGGASRILTAAFIDAHLHIPQFGAEGCDGLPLLEWLDRVVFPQERFFSSSAAAPFTRSAVRRLVREGTFACAAYLSSSGEASRAALSALESSGLRAIAGRVQMDRNAPDDLTSEDRARRNDRPAPPLTLTPSAGSRCAPSLNPRFAIACTEELLAECGWHAKDRPDLFIQTHLAESLPECAFVRELFPDDASYTAVYDRFGLLTDRTLLAHCVHLSPDDWRCIASKNSVVVHCPTANLFLRSGLFDLDAAREHKVRLALGSDVAGGPDASMVRVARAMIETAKSRALLLDRPVTIPTPAEAWAMITRANADALAMPDAGRLEAGAAADLLLLRVPEHWLDEHLVGRLIHSWTPDLIEKRILNGRVVDETMF